MRTPTRRRPLALVAAVGLAALALGAAPVAPATAAPTASASRPAETRAADGDAPEVLSVDVPADPSGTGGDGASGGTVTLDADLYLPDEVPAPAVILAHGFGGSKNDLAPQARRLRADGYVVLAYSARGFGASTGRVSLDSLDAEVPDARALVDLLADRSEVRSDGGDPEVGVAGASYGGALALMLGATDERVDAVAAAATWNDLAQALVPDAAVADDRPGTPTALDPADPRAAGVFKEAWVSRLFGAAADPSGGGCGDFSGVLCAAYTALVQGQPLGEAGRALLARSSPATVLDGLTAPTLLLQGTRDSLFGLDQADATARTLAANGTTVRVAWFDGGHDGGLDDLTAGDAADDIDAWFAEHLPVDAPEEGAGSGGDADAAGAEPFDYPSAVGSGTTRAAAYPGLDGAPAAPTRSLPLDGDTDADAATIVNPPGGVPAAVTVLPGIGALDAAGADAGGLGGAAAGLSAAPAGQSALFVSAPLDEALTVVGASTVALQVAASPTGDSTDDAAEGTVDDAVLFVSLVRVDDTGDADGGAGADSTAGGASAPSTTLLGGAVAPVRVALPVDGGPVEVRVGLPAAVADLPAGARVGIRVATTDALYAASPDAAAYDVRPAGPLELTLAPGAVVASGGTATPWLLAGIAATLLAAAALITAGAVASRRRARRGATGAAATPASIDAPPLVIEHLAKRYPNGLAAVDDLSLTVGHGQVLGLLGPNGAGKTTTLRMVVGLLVPDAGTVRLFGEPVTPGAAVLARVGCFIEGPGFLPHLSGRRNLELYWAASGRDPGEARFDEVLAIADLGAAVERRVGGYSQGMRQRLAIAQAMLGMPELLILDEPTNGLDPPQIFEMRGMLRRYADSGRTVVVSSHLLGEIEQSCTHVAIMAGGRMLAAGSVTELAGRSDEVTFDVSDAEAARRALVAVDGVAADAVVVLSPTRLRVDPGDVPADRLVAALVRAEVGLSGFVSGRHLEETFLELVGR